MSETDVTEELGFGSQTTVKRKRGGVEVEYKLINGDSNAPVRKVAQKSQSIPFMTVPGYMDGSMAGDVGFDPLGFADSKDTLMNYREAEIKHARLAMLAAAGWPISELFDKKIASFIGMEAALDASGRVPNVLNGGMGKISVAYWAFCVALAGAVDAYGSFSATKRKGYTPGNLEFDPLGLYPKDEKGQKWMQTAEIKNGRLAMIAITGFCFQEFFLHSAVIDQTPFFFKPFFQVISEANNNAYIIPEDVTNAVDTVGRATGETVTAPPFDSIPQTATVPSFNSITEVAPVTPPVVDVVPAAPVEAVPAVPVQDAPLALPFDSIPQTTSVAPAPVEVVPAAPVEAASIASPANVAPSVSEEELVAAKKRIAELESKIASINALTQ